MKRLMAVVLGDSSTSDSYVALAYSGDDGAVQGLTWLILVGNRGGRFAGNAVYFCGPGSAVGGA